MKHIRTMPHKPSSHTCEPETRVWVAERETPTPQSGANMFKFVAALFILAGTLGSSQHIINHGNLTADVSHDNVAVCQIHQSAGNESCVSISSHGVKFYTYKF
jgi:hypothetical protein